MTEKFLESLKKNGLKDIRSAVEVNVVNGYLDTGNYALNWIVSGKFRGGWPLGHTAEIYGDPSTGKSFLIARAIAQALENGGVALLDDTEARFNAIWAASGLGVDTSRLGHIKSDTIEDHYDVIGATCQAMSDCKVTAPSCLALDSIANLSTREEIKQGFDKEYMKRAKDIKKMIRLVNIRLSELPIAYLVANHTIANIGDPWKPTTTGGGGGLKFQSSTRIEMRNPKRLKDSEGHYTGVLVKPYVEKSSITIPWRDCEIIIPFFGTISPSSGLVSLLLDHKVLEKTKGNRLAYKGEDTKIFAQMSDPWKQDESAKELVEKYPSLLDELDNDPNFGRPVQGAPMMPEDQKPEEEKEDA